MDTNTKASGREYFCNSTVLFISNNRIKTDIFDQMVINSHKRKYKNINISVNFTFLYLICF